MTGKPGDFIGSGWSFPMGVDSRGGVSLAPGITDIEEAIRIILSTAKGERHMRPTFGCDIHDLVFLPNDAGTHGLIQDAVRNALTQWEPRIEVTDVLIDSEVESDVVLLIDVHYRIRSTNDERNLVYPYYLIQPE